MSETIWIITSFALVLIGLVGVVLPLVPGIVFSWFGFLLFAYVTAFSEISLKLVLIFLALTALSVIFDAVAPLLGARKYRASKFGILGSFAGFLLGILFFGPLGIFLGPPIGAFLGEYLTGREPKEAMQSVRGTMLGFLAGTLVKIVIILIMLGFLVSALF